MNKMMDLKNTICTIEGCGRKAESRQLCGRHYQQYRFKKQATGEWKDESRKFRDACTVEGCSGKHIANGLCRMHLSREFRRVNRAFILQRYFKDGILCKRCKKQYELKQMDAHHPDPSKKDCNLSEVLNNSALQRRPKILAELDTCEFMCTRCHQNLHHDPKVTYESTHLRKDKGRKSDEIKAKIRQEFGESCSKCNDWLYPREMEFHHRDPATKTKEVAKLILFAKWDIIRVEVEKCDILCRNCHRLFLDEVA